MITVIVEGKVTDNAAFDALMREILADTRAFDGCEGISVHRNQDDEAGILLIEHWDTRPQYEKYLKWREDNGTLAKIVALLEGAPSVRFFGNTGV